MVATPKKDADRLPVSVDIVLLTIKDGVLHAALTPRVGEYLHGELALVASTVHINEDNHLGETVERTLRDRGGLSDIYVEQLYTWGDATRDPRGWSISIAYLGLVPVHKLAKAEKQFEFMPVDKLPTLPFDHNKIISTAVWRVRGKGGYSTIPARLLPKEFTMSQMREAYEAVLGRKLDAQSFRRKVMALELVKSTGKKKSLIEEGIDRPTEIFKLRNPAAETFDRML